MSATMIREVLAILLLGLSSGVDAKAKSAVEPWDRLLVTWRKFEGLPLTSADAEKQGWIKDASCGDRNNAFYGNRYVKDNDTSTRVLYDSSGQLAGIQATITGDDNLMPSSKPRPAMYVPDDEGNFLLTAYFTNPLRLCRKPKRKIRAGPEAGDDEAQNGEKRDAIDAKADAEPFKRSNPNRLWFQMSDRRCKPRFMKIPLHEKHLSDKWVKGKCLNTMGVHYWYDVTPDMDCADFLPVFLLYSEQSGQLQAFGWALPAAMRSPRWEHPRPQFLHLFFQQVPKCFASVSARSTQHIYRSDFGKLTCAA